MNLIELRDDPDEPGAVELRVTAEVNGHTYDLLLDTGGARSTLPLDELTSRFEPAHLRVRSARGVLGTATLSTPRVIAPTITLGPIVARNVVVDLATPNSAAPPLLGLDVLKGHRLELRPVEGVLHINSNTPADTERPLLLSAQSHPHLLVGWGELEAIALFDTGASVTVADSGFVDQHPSLFESLGQAAPIDSGGNRATTPTVRMAPCEIGGRRFTASLAVVSPIRGIQRPNDPEFDLILGVPVIRQADWIIDLRRRVWGFALEETD